MLPHYSMGLALQRYKPFLLISSLPLVFHYSHRSSHKLPNGTDCFQREEKMKRAFSDFGKTDGIPTALCKGDMASCKTMFSWLFPLAFSGTVYPACFTAKSLFLLFSLSWFPFFLSGQTVQFYNKWEILTNTELGSVESVCSCSLLSQQRLRQEDGSSLEKLKGSLETEMRARSHLLGIQRETKCLWIITKAARLCRG